jgi:hypothetical protein
MNLKIGKNRNLKHCENEIRKNVQSPMASIKWSNAHVVRDATEK